MALIAAPHSSSIASEFASAEEIVAWMDARHHGTDVVTPALMNRFRATLGRAPMQAVTGDPAPLGLHWCLAPEIVEEADLGSDGLPARGGIIPPIRRLTSRVWAGGTLQFHRPLRAGGQVERASRLTGLAEKSGGSGRLVFAGFQYEYRVDGAICVSETQTVAFRDPAIPALPPTRIPGEKHNERWDFSRVVLATAPMLFRFSALTFNSHRIHYDLPYATAIEGHPGLLVHGPLTAALLLDACADHLGYSAVAAFRARAERPAYCGAQLMLAGRIGATEVELAAIDEAGNTVMRGSATLRR